MSSHLQPQHRAQPAPGGPSQHDETAQIGVHLISYREEATTVESLTTSLVEQRRKIRGVAIMKGLELVEVSQEAGISGSLPLEARPIGNVLIKLSSPATR